MKTKISNEELRKAQLLMLNALLDIDKICKEHNIKYWLDWGTLLGAVRHKGFIPWDDDIDLAMHRDDYNKFVTIAPNLLNNGLFLQTIETDPFYPKRTIPCKVRIDGTSILEKEDIVYGTENDNLYHRGVFIDIFPIDEFTENNFKFKRSFSIPYYLKTISQFSKSKNKTRYYLSRLFRLLPWIFLEKVKEKLVSINGDFLGYGIESPNLDHRFNKTDIFPLSNLDFEGYKFPVPKDYHKYLIELYGNTYMTIPPVEQQEIHILDIKIN
ncbi:LicD family protein [Photobacterium leiognathi]|uniref:LicD family protein n=1 Tax=Photobacterium leiognathi TaxID=553611 RepID=UPI0029812F1D|nr:LicD family protein [Photobacterium leiognathi]